MEVPFTWTINGLPFWSETLSYLDEYLDNVTMREGPQGFPCVI